MNTDIIPFNYKQHEVRTVMIEGEPWFVAKDVCVILGLATRDIRKRLAADEWSNVDRTHLGLKPGKPMVIVNEPGLNVLVMRSDKPEAYDFQRKIAHEILPTIRKTGGIYMTAEKAEQLLNDPDLIIGLAQQVKTLHAERDAAIARAEEAERTKAHITKGREGSLFSLTGTLTQQKNKLASENEKLQKADALRKQFKFFESKYSGTKCEYCGKKIKKSQTMVAIPPTVTGAKKWTCKIHANCLEGYVHTHVYATDAFERALAEA